MNWLDLYQHKGHEFEKISKIYDLHVEKINKEAFVLKKKLNVLYDNMESIEQAIVKLKFSKETKLNEITAVAEKVSINCTELISDHFHQCHSRLDTELKERLLALHKKKKSLAEEIDCFDDMHTHITTQIMQSP